MIKHKVDFILVGGYAVIYYGYERGTADMDIWLKPDNGNRDKFIAAAEEYGIRKEDIAKLGKMNFEKVQVFHIGNKPEKIDFLTRIAGVKYDEADRQKVFFAIKGIKIPVIKYEHLIANKLLSSRMKDRADVEELQKIKQVRKKP